jgi:cell division septation protein DedD
MLTRALIVMLIVLNLGVAAWWWWRPMSVARTEDATPPSGIARLQLLQERKDLAPRPRPATQTPAAATTPIAPSTPSASAAAADIAAATPAAAERCYRIGPFADEAAYNAARNALQPRVARLRTQSTAAERGRGWRVIVPPLPDRAAANALTERLKQAGFKDFFVIGEGAEANAIALGRFSSEDRAQLHASSLRDAGFAARAEPLGSAKPSERWLLVAAAADVDSTAVRRASGAAQVDATDCANLR